MKSTHIAPILFFSVSSFFLGGVFFAEYVDSFGFDSGAEIFQSDSATLNTTRLNDAYAIIEEQYVNADQIDQEALVDGAIKGMLSALDDPYTSYFNTEEFEDFNDSLSGTFEGIGAEIGIRDELLTVVSPLPDTPAERAGLQAGDKILFIDQTDTEGMPVERAVTLIRGEKGTEVTLTIAREAEEVQEIIIERGVINVPEIRVEDLGDGVVHAQVYQFSQRTANELGQQLQNYQRENGQITGVVLDLRGNPGGYLDQAVEMTGLFVELGSVVVTEKFGDGRTEDLKTKERPQFPDTPVVVLVNQGSASASEIVAGALRDLEGVTIVGQTSFGKGSVQKLERLRRGGAVKVTIAEWLTPNGTVIQEAGITPDVEVERTIEDMNNDRDPQLERAAEEIKSQLTQ
jgi:carboxyl-terminal processing protease